MKTREEMYPAVVQVALLGHPAVIQQVRAVTPLTFLTSVTAGSLAPDTAVRRLLDGVTGLLCVTLQWRFADGAAVGVVFEAIGPDAVRVVSGGLGVEAVDGVTDVVAAEGPSGCLSVVMAVGVPYGPRQILKWLANAIGGPLLGGEAREVPPNYHPEDLAAVREPGTVRTVDGRTLRVDGGNGHA